MTTPKSDGSSDAVHERILKRWVMPIKALFAHRRNLLIISLLALIAVGAFAGAVSITGDGGFPLDDSWIHQTYARNFARTGRWEYVPGEVSAGSTSPLWTLILSVGYLIRIPYLLWSFFLGWLCLSWIGWAAVRLWGIVWPDQREVDWISGVVLVLSWPLVWAAGSGMETLLFTALSLEVICLYGRFLQGKRIPLFLLGTASGCLVLARPEGIGLLLLLVLGLFLKGSTLRARVSNIGQLLAGALLPTVPYFAFNYWLSGHFWPNTFYAKQVEYASVYTQSLLSRFSQLLYFSLGGAAEGWRGISGAHLLLLPGVVIAAVKAAAADWTEKKSLRTLPLSWALGIVFIYALRLPVTYQHGRYLFPTLPIWTLYGLRGWLDISSSLTMRVKELNRVHFLFTRVASLTFVALLLIFLILGLQVFGEDVSFVNGEMVTTSLWLRENAKPNNLIAAHDIGAIGYFSERPILDLAGLISPEVIPLLPDEAALTEYVLESGAKFLVTAPGWTYDSLTSSEEAIFQYSTGYEWTVQQGYNNMEIYLLAD